MITVRVRVDDRTDDRLEVLRLDWQGRITGLIGGTVELIVAGQGSVGADELAGRRLTLDFTDDERNITASTPTAVIQSVEQDYDRVADRAILRADLRPAVIRMSVDEHCCTFGDETVEEIISDVLERNGFAAGRDFAFRLDEAAAYAPIPFVAQFDESDLAFVRRLAEYWGLCIALEPRGSGADLLVFTDDPRALSAIPGETMPFVDTGYQFGVTRLRRQVNVLPKRVVLQNYVHERPENGLRVTRDVAFGTSGQKVEHDHNFRSTDRDGAFLARLRAEELSCRRIVYRGEAAGAVLRAGQLCTITGHPIWDDLHLLVTEVETTFQAAPLMQGAEAIPILTQLFVAMPLEIDGLPLRYRPERLTPRPRIHGVLHGVVEESEDRLNRVIDEDGSYRVRLLAHGSDTGPVRALYPRVRMAQPMGGAGAGMHFPIHPGTEVLLSFVDGDPDRPFICGAVPNPRDRSPVTSRAATKNIIQTAAGSRLELDDGPLAAGSGEPATGPAVTGKLHVPYDASRAGSYLRLGRADDREAAESRGPGGAFAADGWYDFTNGARTSVTMGDTAVVWGGGTLERQHGDYFRVKYGSSLAALAPAGAPSEQAGAGSDAVAGGQAMQAVSTDSTKIGAPTTVYGEYDSLIGPHYLKSTNANNSTYTRGTDYSFFGGAKMLTTAGAYVNHMAGLSYASTVGLKVAFEHAVSVSYTGGYKVALDNAGSWDVAKDKTVSAAGSLTLSLRSSPATAAQLLTQKVMQGISLVSTGAAVLTEEAASTVLSTAGEAGWITTMDEALATTRGVIAGGSVLSAVIAALVLVWKAQSKTADALGFGPIIKLDPLRGSMMAGARGMESEVAVMADGSILRAGSLSRVSAVGTKASVESGPPGTPISAIAVTPTGITLSVGAMGIEISATGISVSGQMLVNATPIGGVPEAMNPLFYGL